MRSVWPNVCLPMAVLLLLFIPPRASPAQISGPSCAAAPSRLLPQDFVSGSGARGPSAAALPSAPEPAAVEKPIEPFPTNIYRAPFSRIGIGGGLSPLGIDLNFAIVLNTYMDARLTGNFLQYNSGRFEIQGFNVDAKLHLASAGTVVDVYPWHSIWRLSAGMLFANSNQISAQSRIVPGTSFKLNSQTYYSASSNPATGATPLTGSGELGLHTHDPAFTVSGGFAYFIPRAEHHWSFPTEFGVVFMGSPSVTVNPTGWVCRDAKQTHCANLANPADPVTVDFNNALQTSLNKWRNDLKPWTIYPIISYGVAYSFNIHQR